MSWCKINDNEYDEEDEDLDDVLEEEDEEGTGQGLDTPLLGCSQQGRLLSGRPGVRQSLNNCSSAP